MAILSVDLVESVDLVSVILVVNCIWFELFCIELTCHGGRNLEGTSIFELVLTYAFCWYPYCSVELLSDDMGRQIKGF